MLRDRTPLTLLTALAVALSAQGLARPAAPPRTRTDLYGDPLPAGALARLGSVRWRHRGDVFALAFSADGKRLAGAGGSYGSLYVWDCATGRTLLHARGQPLPVAATAFSPGARLVAFAAGEVFGEGEDHDRVPILVVDGANGRVRSRLPGLPGGTTALAFAPDGKVLAAGGPDGPILLRDTSSGHLIRALKARPAGVGSLAFSADGRRLAAGFADGALSAWEVATGKVVRSFPAPDGGRAVSRLAFTSDGRSLLAWADGGESPGWVVRVLDLASGRARARAECAGGAFAPDPAGGCLALADSGGVRLWDPASGKDRARLRGPVGVVRSLAFSPDGRRLAAADWGGAVRLWDVGTGTQLAPPDGHVSAVTALSFSPGGRTLASAAEHEGAIRLWHPATGRPAGRLEGHIPDVVCLAHSPDGKALASAGAGGELRLWEMPDGWARRALRLDRVVRAVAFSPDGSTLAVLVALPAGVGAPEEEVRQEVRLWDARGQNERRLAVPEGGDRLSRSCALLFSPDGGTLLALLRGAPVRRWDLVTGRARAGTGGGRWAGRAALSPDGRTLAAVRRVGGVSLVEEATGRTRGRLPGTGSADWRIAYSPDGRALACGKGDGTVDVWDLRAGRVYRRLAGGQGAVTALAYAPGAGVLAAGGADGTVLLWGVSAPAGGRPEPLGARELEALWADLSAEDSARAYTAVRALAARPRQAEALFRARLRPAAGPPAGEVRRLLAELDSDDFFVRQKATARLAGLGRAGLPALRRALLRAPSLEARSRLHRLLLRADGRRPRRDELRDVRAVEVLESTGSAGSRRLLRALAGGSPAGVRTQEAESALQRLAKRPPGPYSS